MGELMEQLHFVDGFLFGVGIAGCMACLMYSLLKKHE